MSISFLTATTDTGIAETVQGLASKLSSSVTFSQVPDGTSAWDYVQKHRPDIVVADVKLAGMTGLELCRRIKGHDALRRTYFVACSSDIKDRAEFLKFGADDVLKLPLQRNDIITPLRSALRQVRSTHDIDHKVLEIKALKDEGHKRYVQAIALAASVLFTRIPETRPLLEKVRDIALWIGKEFGELNEEELENIDLASSVALIGKLYLTDEYIHDPVTTDGFFSNPVMCQVPLHADSILASIDRAAKLRLIVRALWENFDGTGFPHKLQGYQIPIETRILRVALDYEGYRQRQALTAPQALKKIKAGEKHIYDHRFSLLVEKYVWSKTDTHRDQYVPLKLVEAKPGMIIGHDVVTHSGIKLLSAGNVLTDSIIERIISHSALDPVLGMLWVRRKDVY